MANVKIPILGHGTTPDSSGNVYVSPLSAISASTSNDLFSTLVIVFANTATLDELVGSFTVPQDYAGTGANINVLWTTDSTTLSGNVDWRFQYYAAAAGETLDATTGQITETTTTIDVDAPATKMALVSTDLALTAANMNVGDIILFKLGRDGTADTLTDDAAVLDVLFEYST